MKLDKEIERIGNVYRDSLAEFRLDEEQRMKMDCLFNNLVGDVKKEVTRKQQRSYWPLAAAEGSFVLLLLAMYLLIYFTS